MKLNIETFMPSDFVGGRRSSGPKIKFTVRGIALNVAAVNLTGLKVGDKVAVHQDKDEPSTWYLSKSPSGFALTQKKARLIFHCGGLATSVMEAFESEAPVSFSIGEEPISYNGSTFWKLTTDESGEESGEGANEEGADHEAAQPKRRGRPRKNPVTI